jgi:hypothetical protein
LNILDKIVEQKKLEVTKLPARIFAAGDMRRKNYSLLA